MCVLLLLLLLLLHTHTHTHTLGGLTNSEIAYSTVEYYLSLLRYSMLDRAKRNQTIQDTPVSNMPDAHVIVDDNDLYTN